jgi:hypothetical protein
VAAGNAGGLDVLRPGPPLPARRPGHLARGSDPRALRGDVLIADEDNRRLLLIDPYGRIRWLFPQPGIPGRGQVLGLSDDAFVSADGRSIVATQEMSETISVIDIATDRITRQYGHLVGAPTGSQLPVRRKRGEPGPLHRRRLLRSGPGRHRQPHRAPIARDAAPLKVTGLHT